MLDYSKTEVPTDYKCGTCGTTGCKLWRRYQTFLDGQTLECCDCAAKSQEEDVSDIDDNGMYTCKSVGQRSDAIGWRVPAVPDEGCETYWGYTSVPEAGVNWWRRLPTRAA